MSSIDFGELAPGDTLAREVIVDPVVITDAFVTAQILGLEAQWDRYGNLPIRTANWVKPLSWRAGVPAIPFTTGLPSVPYGRIAHTTGSWSNSVRLCDRIGQNACTNSAARHSLLNAKKARQMKLFDRPREG